MSTGATNPVALPYPNPDDPVRDGAQRIRELAEKVDRRVWYVTCWYRGFLTTDVNGATFLNYTSLVGMPNAGADIVGMLCTNVQSEDHQVYAVPGGTVPGALVWHTYRQIDRSAAANTGFIFAIQTICSVTT